MASNLRVSHARQIAGQFVLRVETASHLTGGIWTTGTGSSRAQRLGLA